MQPDTTKKTGKDADSKVYKENGDNNTAGKPDSSPRPNNPAENAEKTSPEQDKKAKKR